MITASHYSLPSHADFVCIDPDLVYGFMEEEGEEEEEEEDDWNEVDQSDIADDHRKDYMHSLGGGYSFNEGGGGLGSSPHPTIMSYLR